MWFNQSPAAPFPEFEKTWFQNRAFRVAISQAIHRADLSRLAYDGHATPAYGFISPANTLWYNTHLQVPHEDAGAATSLLLNAGFHKRGNHLYDATGHPVKFSIVTNSGNRAREKMATLIQQDLAALGIEVTVVTLDFPALVERLMHSMNYEACLLGLSNVEPDPKRHDECVAEFLTKSSVESGRKSSRHAMGGTDRSGHGSTGHQPSISGSQARGG